MPYEVMQMIVDRAAELLPEPPWAGNADGQARWEALTLSTGRRLAQLVNADVGLLRTLLEHEFDTPVCYRPRRRLLLRVALLAACGSAETQTA